MGYGYFQKSISQSNVIIKRLLWFNKGTRALTKFKCQSSVYISLRYQYDKIFNYVFNLLIHKKYSYEYHHGRNKIPNREHMKIIFI